MSLKSLQDSFIQQLNNTPLADEFLTQLKPCGNLQSEHQLAIYQNNVRGALQKALAQVYPVSQAILGEKYFKQLASHYIKANPSKQADLNAYGESFAEFINTQSQQRDELTDFPYLGDLAQIEWLRNQVYYAANAVVFDFSAFAQLNEQQQARTVFQLVPCLKFIQSDYPILSIWKMNQEGVDAQQSISFHAENCCIFRNDNQIEMIAIDQQTVCLLALINEGATLSEIAQADYALLLPELINKGWLDSFKVKHV